MIALPLSFGPAPREPAPPLSLAAIVALPVMVETAAWAVEVGDGLRLWISGPGAGRTTQLRLLPGRRLETLPPLAIALAGVAHCGGNLVVTGSDARGRPKALGVAQDGGVLWEVGLEGSGLILWPVPGCAPHPVLLSQESPNRLEVAHLEAGGVARRDSLEVGGPPLAIASGDGTTWVAWGDATGIHGVEIGASGVRAIRIAAPFPGEVAIGSSGGGAVVAWLQGRSAFFVRVATGGEPAVPPRPIDLAGASGGKLVVVPGPELLVWAQRGEVLEGEEPRWTSALVLPGTSPLLVEGFVHAVAWWGDELVVVGASGLYLLKQDSKHHLDARR